jgi:tetrahydromethanopterin S-methyltransferase subunit G
MNTESSIYIPRMSTKWTEEGIRCVMQYHRIGTVSRVDFIPINKRPGFGEDVDQVVVSAFVHFSDPYITADNHHLFRFEMYIGNTEFWYAIENATPYKLQVLDSEYWICLKNNNPVQRTMMNNHQIVENGRHLESIVTEQAEEIKKLKETISELTEKLEGVHKTVYQLVGGLYCQKTQRGIIDIHRHHLGCGYSDGSTAKDTHTSKQWPTTRQGDINTKRIENLEEKLKNLENDLSDYGIL